MCRVYGENFMRNGVMREWCRKFKDGGTVVHDEERHDMTASHTHGAYNLKDYLTSWAKWLYNQRKLGFEELQSNFKVHLTSLAAMFFEEGIGNLVNRCDKCLSLHGDYLEK
ncbi:hypothetical protein AVEN_35074-1 [Araneus ventricosus]|uniref:Mos1 transposase HTH domain-containing protein n=1 Tax=Araneus ventricosus TaxID=182803 RepID=A0A4Y2VQ05_ARAVE|nr:hypothetical protein AVEN_35074-1 [Araneus ventricosus]